MNELAEVSRTELAAALAAGAALGTPRVNPDQDGKAYVVVPKDWRVEQLETRELPSRPRGTTKLYDAASFCVYVNDHKLPRTRIYASIESGLFLAVFDDHRSSDDTDDDTVASQADWREFRAKLELRTSVEWKAWTAANKKPLTQLQMAEFLQDHGTDVVRPDGADLLQMILNFEASSTGHIVSAQRLQDGSQNLVWRKDGNSAGTVKIPETMDLLIPVFENSEPQTLQARLRYRIKEADPQFLVWYELIRPHKVLEAAVRSAWSQVADATGVPILLGTPD